MTVFECSLIKMLPFILFDKYIYISALEMASPRNQHCVNCIGTLSCPIGVPAASIVVVSSHVELHGEDFILLFK